MMMEGFECVIRLQSFRHLLKLVAEIKSTISIICTYFQRSLFKATYVVLLSPGPEDSLSYSLKSSRWAQ